MSYELSFSSEFFLAEGEPYDRSDLALNFDGNPVSVFSAICKLKENTEEWNSLAKEVFDTTGEFLTEETVLEKIEETNTCSNLSSPVSVWIDSEGYYTVEVYDSRD